MNLRRGESRLQKDLSVTRFHEWILPDGTHWTQFFRVGSSYLLRFPEFADFEVSASGREVICHAVPGVSEETTRHLYLNQVVPLALSRQGKLVLHASAVEVGCDAIAFLGEAGRGKSTLAASFATNGSRFLSDDGLIIENGRGGYQVLPSHPSLRLWEDSHNALVHAGSDVLLRVSYSTKSRVPASAALAFCGEARRLSRIYLLGDSLKSAPVFSRLSAGIALVEMVKNSFILDNEDRALIAGHFDQLSALVREPIFFRLDYPRRYDALPEVRAAILRHCDS